MEKVEEAYQNSPAIDQIWVYGNSFKSALVAIIVPHRGYFEKWMDGLGTLQNPIEACSSEEAKTHYKEILQTVASTEKLKHYELIKAIHLEWEPFTVDNDLFTPTFKLKRRTLIKRYQKLIDDLYSSLH